MRWAVLNARRDRFTLVCWVSVFADSCVLIAKPTASGISDRVSKVKISFVEIRQLRKFRLCQNVGVVRLETLLMTAPSKSVRCCRQCVYFSLAYHITYATRAVWLVSVLRFGWWHPAAAGLAR